MWRTTLCGLAVATVACAGNPGRMPSDDVVAVGYGTQSRHQITGAVGSYVPTEADAATPLLQLMLEGRIPGLSVIPQQGGYTLRIRGAGSLHQQSVDDEPLVVIDDIPVARGSLGSVLAGIAPQDVARVDVLKDAGSAAIYGSRGANGVVIITTKRGR